MATKRQLMDLWVRAGGNPRKAGLAADIALAESSGRSNAVNRNTNGTVDRGLWQINSIHGGQSTFDPVANARAAVSISGNGENFRPWVTYNTGAYKRFVGSPGGAPSSQGGVTSRTVTTPGVDNSQARAQAISQFLSSKSADPVDFALTIRGLQDTPGTTTTQNITSPVSSGSGVRSQVLSRANAINARKLPYQWGGGHQSKVDAYHAQPLDCSGAVSAVLGINPRVSGDFQSWGKPGAGGTVTVYANQKHVFMAIRGDDGKFHYWGTSASNPGGGAGWIPQSQISSQYLKGFTARHI